MVAGHRYIFRVPPEKNTTSRKIVFTHTSFKISRMNLENLLTGRTDCAKSFSISTATQGMPTVAYNKHDAVQVTKIAVISKHHTNDARKRWCWKPVVLYVPIIILGACISAYR